MGAKLLLTSSLISDTEREAGREAVSFSNMSFEWFKPAKAQSLWCYALWGNEIDLLSGEREEIELEK